MAMRRVTKGFEAWCSASRRRPRAWLVGDSAGSTSRGSHAGILVARGFLGIRARWNFLQRRFTEFERQTRCLRNLQRHTARMYGWGKAPRSEGHWYQTRRRLDPCKPGPFLPFLQCPLFPPTLLHSPWPRSPNPPLSPVVGPSPSLCHRCLWALLTPPLLIKRTPAQVPLTLHADKPPIFLSNITCAFPRHQSQSTEPSLSPCLSPPRLPTD